MAWIQDTTQSFAITAYLEGEGTITGLTVDNATTGIIYVWDMASWTPDVPIAYPGDSITVAATIQNTGDAADNLYGEFISADVVPAGPLIVSGNVDQDWFLEPSWVFTMPANDVSIMINAGHEE